MLPGKKGKVIGCGTSRNAARVIKPGRCSAITAENSGVCILMVITNLLEPNRTGRP